MALLTSSFVYGSGLPPPASVPVRDTKKWAATTAGEMSWPSSQATMTLQPAPRRSAMYVVAPPSAFCRDSLSNLCGRISTCLTSAPTSAGTALDVEQSRTTAPKTSLASTDFKAPAGQIPTPVPATHDTAVWPAEHDVIFWLSLLPPKPAPYCSPSREAISSTVLSTSSGSVSRSSSWCDQNIWGVRPAAHASWSSAAPLMYRQLCRVNLSALVLGLSPSLEQQSR
mmetsp:Transcript_2020/g.6773  ORF Transcript_2020/g.6773 Transcript_2020/m.6773 type:complete len:226 (-) Transcript_2020:715-1392(-)